MKKRAASRTPKRARTAGSKRSAGAKKRAPAKRAPLAETRIAPEARERFARDLETRGEVATPDESGAVPSHATHVKSDDPDRPRLQRVRFKTF